MTTHTFICEYVLPEGGLCLRTAAVEATKCSHDPSDGSDTYTTYRCLQHAIPEELEDYTVSALLPVNINGKYAHTLRLAKK